MLRNLILAAVLLPLPAAAAELWCMPDTICRPDGSCHATTDEESSVRLDNLATQTATLRSHAESIPMQRHETDSHLTWDGANEAGQAEKLMVTKADSAFVYTQTLDDGQVWTATGHCEVQ